MTRLARFVLFLALRVILLWWLIAPETKKWLKSLRHRSSRCWRR